METCCKGLMQIEVTNSLTKESLGDHVDIYFVRIVVTSNDMKIRAVSSMVISSFDVICCHQVSVKSIELLGIDKVFGKL